MTLEEITARISRAKSCLENSTDSSDRHHWSTVLIQAIRERNEMLAKTENVGVRV